MYYNDVLLHICEVDNVGRNTRMEIGIRKQARINEDTGRQDNKNMDG